MHSVQSTDRYLGWKTLGVFTLSYAVAWVGGAVWGVGATQVGRLLQLGENTISNLSILGIAAIRMFVWIPATRLVLKRNLLRDLAFPIHRRWWADLLVGLLMTSLAILLVFILSVQAGWLVLEGWVWQILPFDELLGKLWVSLLINVMVALIEELAFRSYLLTGLVEAWGKPIGLAVMGAIFGIAHTPALVSNTPPVIAMTLLFMSAFGMLVGWIYLQTGSLWMPVAMHFAWDFVENDLLNLSGDMTNPHVVGAVARLVGPSSLPGIGNAVLVNILVFIILCAGAWLWIAIRQRRL